MTHDPNRNIKDLLSEFRQNGKFKSKLDGQAVKDAWQELYSKNIAPFTLDIHFKEGELTIKLSSAPLREELSRDKKRIIDNLNQHIGHQLVKTLKLL